MLVEAGGGRPAYVFVFLVVIPVGDLLFFVTPPICHLDRSEA
jgi:hypothetical protein